MGESAENNRNKSKGVETTYGRSRSIVPIALRRESIEMKKLLKRGKRGGGGSDGERVVGRRVKSGLEERCCLIWMRPYEKKCSRKVDRQK